MSSASVPTLARKPSFVQNGTIANATSAAIPNPPYSAPATTTTTATSPVNATAPPPSVPMVQQSSSYNGQGSIATMNDMYEVGEVIGTGTFGIIRKVTRKSDGLVLARKELDYGRMDERDLKQLSEEVNILQNLEPNENIVRYYERYVDRQSFRLHIIMEYCHNGDLAAQIQRCRRKNVLLHEDTVWLYLAQIAMALSDCHAEQDKHGRTKQVILHRDIKPENVFLDKDNQIKLGDFGLSKAMASAAFTNTYVGTPYYMSPELINGQAYDNKSDIWALGCLIFELCAWHPPFHEARTQAELTKLIRDGRIPNLPGRYSQNLQTIVKLMLRQDPKQRPNIEQIKNLDEVKLQLRIMQLGRMHEEIKVRIAQLVARETAVLERERVLITRERDLETERAELQQERVRLAQAFASTTVTYQSSSSSGFSTSGTSSGLSSRDTSPMVDQKENSAQSIGSPVDMHHEPGASKTLSRMSSRPSLVPRRPLEERRASTLSSNSHGLTKRYSVQSLQNVMAVDGETPIKNGVNTPATDGRKRGIASSKSMHNLKSSGGSRNDSPTMRAPPSSLAGSRQNGPSSATVPSFNFTQAPPARPMSTATLPEGFAMHTRRSDSSASLATTSVSPSKRPQPMSRTATAPPSIPAATSTASLASLAAALPNVAPRYNLEDEDSLPSPFLKKKASMGLRAMVAAQAVAGMSGAGSITRRQSNSNLASGSITTGSARGLRPSTTRQSLAGKLALHRQSTTKVDEQGRRVAQS